LVFFVFCVFVCCFIVVERMFVCLFGYLLKGILSICVQNVRE